MYNNHELQDQDLQLAAANQIVELDDNDLDNVAGGAIRILFPTRRHRYIAEFFRGPLGASLSTPKA